MASEASASRSRPQDESIVDAVTSIFETMKLGGSFRTELAAKPAKPGSLGRPVHLVTNLFKIQVRDKIAYHYDITFRSKRNSRNSEAGDVEAFSEPISVGRILKPLFQQLNEQDDILKTKRVFFDGKKNMFALNEELAIEGPKRELDLAAVIDDEERMFRVEYFNTGHVANLQALSEYGGVGDGVVMRDAIQALEIGLGYEAGLQMIQRGVKFFERSVEPMNMNSMNLELRMG